ncbi:NACHT domain-containing protein [Leptodontidium sp. 2 PMI_412]|nr:NACHT domain-containing protein [Leptodontidium sp. 2 PMI_412]
MAPWKEQFKAKFGRKKPPTPPLGEARSTSITPHALTIPDPTAPPPSSPEQLWNQAYDQAKTADSSTVETYEKILSARLSQKDADPTNSSHSADLASQQNTIESDPGKRWKQMCQLVQDGLHRTEKDTNVKQGIQDGIQAAMAVKEVVDRAIQAAPEAALAWVGVCFALEILMNPLTQASSNRQGIAYVVSRMDWYWNLSSLLLDENMNEAHSQGLRGELEKIITQLYAKLLLYQMKSICYYHRGRLSVFMWDLLKLGNWDGELSDIQAAEAAVQSDSAQYNTVSIRNRLGSIAETAKSQNAKLDSISSAIREQTKQRERMHKTSADNKCLDDLCSTDPRHDKARIEETKGGLLKDSYRWILQHPDFQCWRNDPQSRLLWVKADPGKGKTMLLCGIINELKESMAQTGLLTYFFCQATDSRINNATAVLRGLVYLLVDQQPSLMSHIRKKYDHRGKSLFEDANAWVALSDIFTNILQDPNLHNTYLIIDALDECVTDLPKLLDFIVKKSSASPRVKWIISSRNWPSIERDLEAVTQNAELRLELNEKSVSAAVATYIQSKVEELAKRNRYSNNTLDAVQRYLSLNANGTFLWVALVCQELFNISGWRAKQMVTAFPPGLDALYKRMLGQIRDSSDAKLCTSILAIASAVYRPVTLDELASFVDLPDGVSGDSEALSEIIALCGSFLTLRERTVSFVHQSAKDFLLKEACHDIFPSGTNDIHYTIFSRSLQVMSKTLRRDVYRLSAPGISIDQVKPPDLDPLAVARYSCLFWADHLLDCMTKDSGPVYSFLCQSFLYWLEALSLMKSLSDGIIMIRKLENWFQADESPDLYVFIHDAKRFALYNRSIIEQAPLQLYCSALIFAPERSIVRRQFERYIPTWIQRKPKVQVDWNAALQTLEGHSSAVTSVSFSPDGKQVVSGSHDHTNLLEDLSATVLSNH